MDGQRIFRIKKRQRFSMLVLSVLAPIAVVAFLLFLNPYSLAEADKFWEFFGEVIDWFYIAFMFIICGLLAYSTYSLWKDLLVWI